MRPWQAGLLLRFAHCHPQNIRIAVTMAPWLQPQSELGMMRQQSVCARNIDDPGGPGDMSDGERALETIGVLTNK